MTKHRPPTAPLTELVGRDREIGEVAHLFLDSRLVTLTGPGGIGKTRLARAVVDRGRDDFEGEIVWVALGSVSRPELVPDEVAAELGLTELRDGSLEEQVARELGDRPVVLALDDCEHLVDAVAGTVRDLLEACPRFTVLATSREALGVAGERAWLVPPLSLPDETPSSPSGLLESDAARLFLERARDADPTFRVDDRVLEPVARICRRLDGIPLAIELAAARVRVLPPAQIAERLSDAFHLLTGGPRTELPRHRTLRATMDWSYGLLAELERLLLRRLSVFHGGFTLDAAEAVCSDGTLHAGQVLERLAALVDRSLVRMRERDGTARYSLLEIVRMYASERLEEAGPDEAERIRRAHALHFLASAETVAPRLERLEHVPEVLDEFEGEHDNVRAALAWALGEEPGTALRLAGALAWFWITAGHWREGAAHLEDALEATSDGLDGSARARALTGAGALAFLLHDLPGARARYAAATELWRRLEEVPETARSLAVLAQVRAESGDAGGARADIDEALRLARAHGSEWLLAWVLGCAGAVHRSLGGLEEAEGAYGEAEAVARGAGSSSLWLLEAPLARALVALLDGDPRRAAVHARAAVRSARSMGAGWFGARALLATSAVAARAGNLATAARILGSFSRTTTEERAVVPHEERIHDDLATSLREGLGDDAFEAATSDASSLDLEHALEVAEEYLEERRRRDLGAVTERHSRASIAASEPGRHGGVAATSEERSDGAPTFRVLALGPLEIHRNGLPLPAQAWRYAKPRELFLFLLCHPRGVTRDQVGLAFWPEGSTAQVKNNFHVALHRLRRVLGDSRWIVLEQDRYRLHPWLELDFDADRFEAGVSSTLEAIRRGDDAPEVLDRLRDSLALYRGDFLEGEDVGDWHLDRRDALRRLFVRGQSALAEAHLGEGRPEEAAAAFQAVIGVDDLAEEAYRGLMVARARTGDRSGALRLFQRLEAVLDEELDADPEPETSDLADRLRRNADV